MGGRRAVAPALTPPGFEAIENNALKCLVAEMIRVTGSVPCELNRLNIRLILNSLPAKITFNTSSMSASLEVGVQFIIS